MARANGAGWADGAFARAFARSRTRSVELTPSDRASAEIRDDRFGLRWRLHLDALDAAFWVLSPRPPTGHYDFAVFIAVPLAVEAGVRMGWRGLVVPAALTVSVGVAAAAAGKPVLFGGSEWLVISVALGVAFLRYCRRLDGGVPIAV